MGVVAELFRSASVAEPNRAFLAFRTPSESEARSIRRDGAVGADRVADHVDQVVDDVKAPVEIIGESVVDFRAGQIVRAKVTINAGKGDGGVVGAVHAFETD